MARTCEFSEVGRLPRPGDNVAIATRRLEAGTAIQCGDASVALDHTVLEGHRFAVQPIAAGEELQSWGLPFGVALRDIAPGMYACNQEILEALRGRDLDLALPDEPNFQDRIEPYHLDEAAVEPGRQVELSAERRTFSGYARGEGRGVGTRNYIVVLGTSSRTASFARVLAARLQEAAAACEHVDGVVAVAHTEGGGRGAPNNQEFLLRALAGFMVHPNVGAVLAVDCGTEAVTNQMLQQYMAAHDYPLDQVMHHFLSLEGSFRAHLEEEEKRLAIWLRAMDSVRRSEHSLDHLKIALQCGGSDAFSGISGNPLAAWAAREVIRHGGSANLAETDELIGAESYVLQNVRDLDTAREFLHLVERFKERTAWHGTSAEGNPSGGNKLRGLYNIVLKSIGAAMKRHPEVRLDHVIDYGESMSAPGFYFMDSPGNDLESMAGQVASGCNMIFFVTGNGSVVNFPFVPTIKLVTTTPRYELLAGEMDVNAGAYQDGASMDDLGRDLFERTLAVAGGRPSLGEQAGHSQVSIWRNWQQTDASRLEELLSAFPPLGERVAIQEEAGPDLRFEVFHTERGHATDQLGLILPTSLCSAQIARLAAERLNAKELGREQGISRFAALMHTEGCGLTSPGVTEQMHLRTLVGYLTHPLVRRALLLEHGCEKTHNDYMRDQIERLGLDPQSMGWASVQLDGGMDKVLDKVEDWFRASLDTVRPPERKEVGLEALHLGLQAVGPFPEEVAQCLARLTRWVVGAGGSVIVPENAGLLATPAYVDGVLKAPSVEASLAYGQPMKVSGFYIMETPTDHWVETLTGLGATGVEMVLVHAGEHPVPGSPLVPVVQISVDEAVQERCGEDLDLALEGPAAPWAEQVVQLLVKVASRQYSPRAVAQGNIDFQLTRGLLGVSA